MPIAVNVICTYVSANYYHQPKFSIFLDSAIPRVILHVLVLPPNAVYKLNDSTIHTTDIHIYCIVARLQLKQTYFPKFQFLTIPTHDTMTTSAQLPAKMLEKYRLEATKYHRQRSSAALL